MSGSSITSLLRPSELAGSIQVLIVAPHPDDECLMGGYALRMKAEWGAKVSVLPYSLGSDESRKPTRSSELDAALKVLGFDRASGSIDEALKSLKPNVIFSPHAHDRHPTHEACHQDVLRTLKVHPQENRLWVQSEFWGEMKTPNRLVEYSLEQVIQLGEALSMHVGEVSRNPYHLRLPAWFMDQVRKGSETVISAEAVGGFGEEAPQFVFGQLYHEVLA